MKKHTTSLALLLAGTLALTGCGRNPVAPESAIPAGPGASTVQGTQTEDPAPDVVGEPGASASVHVAANEAGTLTLGRWSLTIHKNSHVDPATISMTILDPDAMEVLIEVSPASANVFQVPIELVADCTDQVNMVMEDNTIFWWNGGWEPATDVTTQNGSMLIKAKTGQLMNAKVSPKAAVETVRGRK